MTHPVIEALCRLSYLPPKDREAWVDKHVLGIGERRQAERDGVSNYGIYYRVKRADRKLRMLVRA